jgi:hypothetical protein
MPNPSSLNVIYDLSVKQFDFVDRAYESLTSRAASMIGWTSFITGVAIFLQKGLGESWSRLLFGGSVCFLGIMGLVSALLAYRTNEVEPWPHALLVYRGYAEKPEDETKLQLMADIEKAIKTNTKFLTAKSEHIDRAIKCLAGLSIALAIFFFLTGILPES